MMIFLFLVTLISGLWLEFSGRHEAARAMLVVLFLISGWFIAGLDIARQCEQMGTFESRGKVYICSERK